MVLASKHVMKVREIPPNQWPAFLDRLGREQRAWLATVDHGGRVETREQPLESIAAKDGIDIRVGAKAIHVGEPLARLTLRFSIAPPPNPIDGIT